MSKKLPYKGNSRLKNNNFFNSGIERLLARINSIELETLLGASSSSSSIEVYRGLDVEALLEAILAGGGPMNEGGIVDPEYWKASFTIAFPAEDTLINGQFETIGDFETEESTFNLVGIAKTAGESDRTNVIASSQFKPTGGTTLEGIEISSGGNIYDFDNLTWTYKYEEDPTATGSDPKYLHDFNFSIESIQVFGYVVIGADDSVIAGNIIGIDPSEGGDPGGPCDPTLNFGIGLTNAVDPTQLLIGVDTFTGNDFNGVLEIRSVEGSPVATSYAGPDQNLDFSMPTIDQSPSDTYEYVLYLNDDNTGCNYCKSSAMSGTIVLVLNDPQVSETADNDPGGMGCGSLTPPPPAEPK
jgi:hypothetical protein